MCDILSNSCFRSSTCFLLQFLHCSCELLILHLQRCDHLLQHPSKDSSTRVGTVEDLPRKSAPPKHGGSMHPSSLRWQLCSNTNSKSTTTGLLNQFPYHRCSATTLRVMRSDFDAVLLWTHVGMVRRDFGILECTEEQIINHLCSRWVERNPVLPLVVPRACSFQPDEENQVHTSRDNDIYTFTVSTFLPQVWLLHLKSDIIISSLLPKISFPISDICHKCLSLDQNLMMCAQTWLMRPCH